MSDADQPPTADLRQQAIDRYTGLNPEQDPVFAELAALAARWCDTPIAAVSLIGSSHQRFIAKVGLELDELPIDDTFCGFVVEQKETVVIEDARTDARLANHPQRTAELGIRFYAGHPLITVDDVSVGTICVADRKPRQLSAAQLATLRLLAHQAITHLELQRHVLELERENEEHRRTEEALRAAEQKFRAIFEHSTDGIFQSTPDGKFIAANSTLAGIYGFNSSEDLLAHFNDIGAQLYVDPRRREDFVRELQEHDVIVGFEAQVRNRHGKPIWISENARAVRNQHGRLLYYEGTVEDITERRKAAAAVRDSERRFRSIWERSADGMRLTDQAGIVRAVNPAYCRIVGMSEEEVTGQPFTAPYHAEFFPADRLERYQENFRVRNIPEHLEQHYVFRSGRAADLELSNSFLEFEGQDALVLSIFHDVTARKAVEAALRESELLYHSLVGHLPQNIFRKDAEGRFTFVNQRFCDELGKPAEEILGRTDADFFPSALAEKYHRDDQRIMREGKPFEVVEAHYVPGKGKIYVQVIKSPLLDPEGKCLGIQGIFWDVTERKRIEEQLAFERDLLRALLDNVPDRIYFKDTESRFLQCSLAMAKRLGLKDPAEVVGKRDADFHPAEQAREYFEDEQRILMTGTPIINKIERQTASDGQAIWASVTKVPTRNRAGFITGIIGISRDITELKKVEEELELARDGALESTRLKSQFLAAMSHEIRTPMNGIIGMTELLLDADLTPAQKEFAETISTSARSLLHIINDILDFSKIEAGKMEIEQTAFDLVNVAETSLELLAHRAQAKNLDPVAWIDPDVPRHLIGDPVRLGQILVNLLGNAVKFTEQGDAYLRIEKINETADRARVKFSVIDQGIGIAPEAQARIFEAFTQADGTSTRKYGGTGLGLSISRQLVELMGGEMGLQSQPGAGSTFWFTLEFSKAPAAEPPPAPSHVLDGVQLLVAVENRIRRQALLQTASAWGMKCAVTGTGAETLTCLSEAARVGQAFDLALLDIKLPDTDGLSLAESITMDPTLPDIRLILLTPLGQRMDADILKLAGFSAALFKPLRRDRLRDCMSRVLVRPDGASDLAGDTTIPPRESPTGFAVHKPLRVLLVEDNTVNQKVALLQLNKLGVTPDLVTDGAQAVESYQRGSYDLVLMDCQMPVMDGYEATRRIRNFELEHERGRTRIVAMTADASRDHTENARQSGMDESITKPVHLPDLRAVLDSVQQEVAFRPAAQAAESTEEVTLDHSVLNNLRELQEPDEPDPVAELIDLFLADAPMRLHKLREGLAAHDQETARVAVHSLKGSARNIGGRALAARCEAAEERVKAANWDGLATDLEQIHAEWHLLEAALLAAKNFDGLPV